MLIRKSAGIVQPGRGDVHVNRPLTNISIAFLQNADNFVARQVFPRISVSKQSDLYYTIPRGAFFRSQMKKRAPATESAGGNYEIGTDNYFAHVYAEHKDIADQVRANYDQPLDADRETTVFLTQQGLLLNEITFRENYFKDGQAPGDVWTWVADGAATVSGSLDFTDGANNNLVYWNRPGSTPIKDARRALRTVHRNTGFRPNTLTLGRDVYDELVDHPDIIGRIDGGQTPGGPAMVTRQNLAALFEVDRVLIMDGVENAAEEGLPDAFDFIGGKNVLLSYRPAAPGLMTPSAGYTFSWTGLLGSGADGLAISTMRMPTLKSDRHEIEMAFDMKRVSTDLGFFFNGIVE